MFKKFLLLIAVLVSFTAIYADDNLWIDVNFTRDSTTWKEVLGPLTETGRWEGIGPNLQVTGLTGTYTVGDNAYGIVGSFGRFAVNNYSYTPFNAENIEEQFIYAYRLANNDNTYFTLPGTSDVGSVKIHYLCGNATGEGLIKLQKFDGLEEIPGEEGGDPTYVEKWVDFDPAITFDVPPHGFATSSFYDVKEVNLNEVNKLRLKGPALKNVHIFTIQVSKYVHSGVQENRMDDLQFTLSGKVLTVSNNTVHFNAEVYNLAGVHVGSFTTNEAYTFTASGVYMVKVKNGLGSLTKKLIVF